MSFAEYLFAFELPPAIVESVPVLVVGLDDPEGKILHASPLVEDLFGYERGTLRGRPMEVLLPELTRAHHVSRRESYARDPQTRSMNGGVRVPAVRRDGRQILVQVSLCKRTISGLPCVVACVIEVASPPPASLPPASLFPAPPIKEQ